MRVAAVRLLAVACVVLVSIAGAAQTPARSLLTKPIDESRLTVLKGNTHPLARTEFDQGAAPADLPMNRMLLVLKRSDEQETALRTLVDDQQDKASPNYHKWVTPEVFGKQFGPSDQDIQQVTSWLQSHGFQIAQVSKGRTIIEFSGTASQVQEAFHTSIHQYSVGGAQRWANASDPQIPEALTPVVAGVFSLHNFLKKPQINISNEQFTAKHLPNGKPEFTSSNGQHALTPTDYNVIYNIPSPSSSSATIAIVGRSNINLQDVMAFHSLMADSANYTQILLNGPDPGDLGGGEEAEAVLDTTWSGAVAAGAAVTLVVSGSTNTTDGVDLSELYVIDNNLADVMSESFGGCEAHHTAADAAAHSDLAQQAAAEGITYLVSSGDSGAAGCADPNKGAPATGPFSVNILASTPYTVAVGGTMFYENGQDSSYWSPNNSSNFGSAISYIPEKAWNESSSRSIWAGSGGASTYFSKPNWQAGFGDSARDIPDVSLTAAAHDPYLMCLDNSCAPNSQGQFFFAGAAGTSAAAPAFAGIMARVVQQTGSRQGLANYVLYKLAAAEVFSKCNGSVPGGLISSCVFNDVTVGNISVPGDPDYGTATAKYQTSAGFDLATGLGSVNVSNLLNAWNTASFNATTTTASISPLNAIHGAAMNVNVSVASHSGTPTGSVWLQRNGLTGVLVGDSTQAIFTLDASGSVAAPTHVLLGGAYQLTAHYAGDANYAASDSAPVSVNIQPEPSATTMSLLVKDSSGNLVPFTSIQYGLPFVMKAHVAGNSGYGTPTSYVDFLGSSVYYGNGYLDRNGDGSAIPASNFPPGSYSAHARYYGDPSFAGSTSSSASFTITQASTTISLNSSPGAQGTTLTASFTVDGTIPLAGNPPTGSVNFYNGSSLLGSSPITDFFNGTQLISATFSASELANGQYLMTASYAGDINYLPSVSAPISVSLQPDFSLSPATNLLTIATPGQQAELDVVTNFYGGFAGPVAFTCSGLPSETTCTSTPVTAAGTSAIIVKTTAPITKRAALSRKPFYLVPFASGVAGMFLLGLPSRRRRSAGVFFVLLLAGTTSCGGGSASTPAPAIQTNPGTPLGSYTVTVNASSGTLSHSFLVTLSVQ